MERNHILRKGLVIGIILLFIGSCIIPVTAQKIIEKQNDMPKNCLVIPNVFPNKIYQDTLSSTINGEFNHLPIHLKLNPLSYRIIFYHQWESRQLPDTRINVREKQTSKLTTPCSVGGNDGNYTVHTPIWIYGDSQFTVDNGVVGGNGTIDDPYIIEGWEIISPNGAGIKIDNTRSYFMVRDCLLEAQFGICTYNVSFGDFDNLIIHVINLGMGLQLEHSSNLSLSNSTINNNLSVGIYANAVDYFSITNCTVSNATSSGLMLLYASLLTLSNLKIHECYTGIIISDYSHIVLKECEVYSNSDGIIIVYSQDAMLKNNIIHDNTYNFGVYGSTFEQYYHDIDTSNTVDGKPIYYLYNVSNAVFNGSMDIGYLALIHGNNITISDYSPTQCYSGVLLVGTGFSMISSCVFQDVDLAIILFGCSHNIIRNCTSDNAAIALVNSPHTVLRNNTIDTLFYSGLFVDGEKIEDYYQDIDTSNVLNGKPVYYLVGVKNKIFKESNVGYLAFVNCKHILVSHVNIGKNVQGILIVKTNAIINKCEFSDNQCGIYIVNKSHAIIYNTKIINNDFGFVFKGCSGTVVNRCNISGNSVGFDINNSHNNIIKSCQISNQGLNGFQIMNSWNNSLCGNTISHNAYEGIAMVGDCWGNEMCANTFSNGGTGIWIIYDLTSSNPSFLGPHNNNIHHNDIYQMKYCGIDMEYADENAIHHNSIHENQVGLTIISCKDNKIFNNNICNNQNGVQALNCKVNMTENWWGGSDGPSGEGPGSGDSVWSFNATITFEPWLTQAANVKPTFLQCLLACLRVRLRY